MMKGFIKAIPAERDIFFVN